MAENSKIEWTDHTFNPWIGCTKVSAACDHCYAEAWDARGLQQRETRWGPHADRTRTSAANWRKPMAWNKAAAASGTRARVFCASLADVFDNHRSISDGWRAGLWRLIADTPHLDWLLLTKRPQNITKMLPDQFGLPAWGNGWANVWLGTTAENQTEANRRIPHLLAVPAAVRFLSMEPLFGPVDLTQIDIDGDSEMDALNPAAWSDEVERWRDTEAEWQESFCDWYGLSEIPTSGNMHPTIDWVIVGGESGPHARPMHPDWARSLRDQCAAAGVPFLFKQWGEHEADEIGPEDARSTSYPPGHVIFRKVGKARAGRKLDGVEHNGFPQIGGAA